MWRIFHDSLLGSTISVSIPSCILSLAMLRCAKDSTLLVSMCAVCEREKHGMTSHKTQEINMIQTGASAGSALMAGVPLVFSTCLRSDAILTLALIGRVQCV